MQDVTLIGIDLGKRSFHQHGQDRRGRMVFRRKVTRKQLIEFFASFHACTVVIEACAGAHYMARKLATSGHEVKLISPQFVRPFVESNKIDFVDPIKPFWTWCPLSYEGLRFVISRHKCS
jgi:transposase